VLQAGHLSSVLPGDNCPLATAARGLGVKSLDANHARYLISSLSALSFGEIAVRAPRRGTNK